MAAMITDVIANIARLRTRITIRKEVQGIAYARPVPSARPRDIGYDGLYGELDGLLGGDRGSYRHHRLSDGDCARGSTGGHPRSYAGVPLREVVSRLVRRSGPWTAFTLVAVLVFSLVVVPPSPA